MGQALYRKYRSKTLSEIVGQEHITKVLAQAIQEQRISHAYLLTGPRGVGKTSIARILAHEVNGLPYNEDAADHLDIIEIDAASNRRIDEIRDLRDKVHSAPAAAKYKVYIIDEVHMLTREAFNALLKTLEEPPAHVIFILATTEMHKLPETIVSRTQHFGFRPIDQAKVVEHLTTIAKKEKVQIDQDALELIARYGEGSFRDSISLLDQMRSYADHITLADVQAMLGIAADEAVTTMLKLVQKGDAAGLIQQLQQLRGQGIQPALLAKQLSSTIRDQLLATKPVINRATAMQLLKSLIDIPASQDPFSSLELTLLDSAFSQAGIVTSAAPAVDITISTDPPNSSPKEDKVAPKSVAATKSAAIKAAPEKLKSAASKNTASSEPTAAITINFDQASWQAVLEKIKNQYNTLYGVLRMAEPSYQDGTLTLAFKFAFHQKRVNEAKNKKIVADAITEMYGSIIEVLCIMADTSAAKVSLAAAPVPGQASPLGDISNIFGGGELLES